jgi:hypothetical protein
MEWGRRSSPPSCASAPRCAVLRDELEVVEEEAAGLRAIMRALMIVGLDPERPWEPLRETIETDLERARSTPRRIRTCGHRPCA